jgi:two-component system chemotaxis response regulator CheB
MQKSTKKEIDNEGPYRVIVIGASAGGREALERILSGLPADYAVPILIAQHLHSDDGGGFARSLGSKIRLSVVSPCDKKKIEPGNVYVAPANYHMLVERTGHTALSIEEKVKWSRPSIDVLFESAAYVWEEKVIAVLLTGSNDDGVEGMRTVRAHGGLTIAQEPATAEHPVMPQAAIDAKTTERVMTLEEISQFLAQF